MHLRTVPWLVGMAVLLAACDDAKISAYRVPSEKPDPLPPVLTGGVAPASAGTSGGGMAAASVPTAQGPGLTWSAPAHWKAKPATAMRKGSFSVPGENGADADCSVTAFPGDVGGELANFNRWRNQLGLPPLPQKDMEDLVARLDQNGLKFAVVEFVNRSVDKPQRVVGALVPYEGATWFFKLVGPEELVAREKPAFFAFLQSVKPATP